MIGATLIRINQATLIEALQEYFDARLTDGALQAVVRVSAGADASTYDVTSGAALETVVVHLSSRLPTSEEPDS